jgi:hypothetical protein
MVQKLSKACGDAMRRSRFVRGNHSVAGQYFGVVLMNSLQLLCALATVFVGGVAVAQTDKAEIVRAGFARCLTIRGVTANPGEDGNDYLEIAFGTTWKGNENVREILNEMAENRGTEGICIALSWTWQEKGRDCKPTINEVGSFARPAEGTFRSRMTFSEFFRGATDDEVTCILAIDYTVFDGPRFADGTRVIARGVGIASQVVVISRTRKDDAFSYSVKPIEKKSSNENDRQTTNKPGKN